MGQTSKGSGGPREGRRLGEIWKENRLRLIGAAVFLVIAVAAIAYGVYSLVSRQSGWQTIEAVGSTGESCAGDFTLLYEIGAGGQSASAEYRAVAALYSTAAHTAYRLFNCYQSFDGVTNLYDLAQSPNTVFTVDDALYRAFDLIRRSGERSIYLGPIHERYDTLFSCTEDWQTADFDPRQSAEIAEFYGEIAAFAGDPASIDLELLGNDQVRLNVSAEYLAFLQENELTCLLDLSWMTNAFSADYLAEQLTGAGYTHGALTSYDGFVRNLDDRGGRYSLNLFDRPESAYLVAGALEYASPAALVSLRSFPLSSQDEWRCYEMSDGDIRTTFLDPADGLCKAALPTLTCWSRDAGCAEMALSMAPVYIAEKFDPAAADALAEDGIWTVWCREGVIHSNGKDADVTNLHSAYTLAD